VALDDFELLELRRDDGVQTFHARHIATARHVQVHLLDRLSRPEILTLLSRISSLPEPERRRVIERGVSRGRPYVVTERLAGFASFREWLESKTPAASLDQRFQDLFEDEAQEPQSQASHPKKGIPLGAMAWGVMVALLFLSLVIAVFAFRPR